MSYVPAPLVVVTTLVVTMAIAGCAAESVPGATPTPTATISPSASASPPAGSTSPPTASANPPESVAPSRAATLATVDVVLITAGSDEHGFYASGLVPDLVESGGECVLTASNETIELTARISSVAATSATNCGLVSIPATPGDWRLTLSYASSTSEGHSETVIVSVQ